MDIEQQKKNTDKEISFKKDNMPPGLSGWLILIALHLFVIATVYGVSLLAIFSRPDIYFRLQHVSERVFFILTSIVSAFSIALIISALIAFFSKKYIFVGRYRLFVYSIALISVVDCASLLWFHAMGYDFDYRYTDGDMLFKKVMIAFIHPVFLVCVCIPYLEKSKRVKEIFVR